MLRLAPLVLAALLPMPASAQDAQDAQILVYRQQLGGVFFQDWILRDEKRFAAGIRTTVLIGEGKAGDFLGELYIDCPDPAGSKWLSVDGDVNLTNADVPGEVINAIRTRMCTD